MPNFKTYSDGKAIYSVDMMLAYVNTHTHPIIKLSLEELLSQLDQKVWSDAPKNVIDHMSAHATNAERIRHADLTYPIMVTGAPTPRTRRHVIVDGYHRVAKAYMEGKKEINAYVFDAARCSSVFHPLEPRRLQPRERPEISRRTRDTTQIGRQCNPRHQKRKGHTTVSTCVGLVHVLRWMECVS